MKNRKNNIINLLMVGAIMFACNCTLCNKKYNMQAFAQKLEAVLETIAPTTNRQDEITQIMKTEVSNVK